MNMTNEPTRSIQNFYAHSMEGKDKQNWQKLSDHLKKTAEIAYELGKDTNLSQLASIAGLLHDIGKYSNAFQKRLERKGGQHIDHSTAGAREVMKLADKQSKMIADLLSYCIAGHHSGLPDYGNEFDVDSDSSLIARREKKEIEDYSFYKTDLDISKIEFTRPSIRPIKKHWGFSVSFLTKMIFSILVDADWIETETFFNGGKKPRGIYESIDSLCFRFNNFVDKFKRTDSPINVKRTEILEACIKKSDTKQGIFTLTVPTGGGKTISSMAFALNHAKYHGLKRIIYVIPYTNIIEQNASVFKNILGHQNVLEHHSNFDWEQAGKNPEDEDRDITEKLKLASENWDIPIIVTTNVQFFESIFSNRSSRLRKLHNLAKSVIIFDEAQMLPRDYLQPCMCALQELVQNYSASIIFCTATQPSLKKFFPDYPEFVEIAPNPTQLANFFKRVKFQYIGKLTDDELITKLNENKQTLCIVNTRRHAKKLFSLLQGTNSFHLSTLMCPRHRKNQLTRIKECLNNGEECHLISTQVIEAGVDIDFPVGYRAIAGLDSILQAGGRVNREGKMNKGNLFIFNPISEYVQRTPAYIKQTAEIAKIILENKKCDISSIDAMNLYYQYLFSLQDEKAAFDVKNILRFFDKDEFDFASAAEIFKLIEENAKPIIIPFDNTSKELIHTLRFNPSPIETLRKLQIYTVNIFELEYERLMAIGALEIINGKYSILADMNQYDNNTGINIPENESDALLICD